MAEIWKSLVEDYNTFKAAFGIQEETIFVLAVSFAILVFVLRKILFKPIMKHLDERSNEIKGTFDKIELDKKEIERLTQEYQAKLATIEKEAYQKTQAAIKEGLAAKTELISEAHAQADNVLRKAKEEIQIEKKKALAEMKNEMVSLALSAASKVIKEKMDEKVHGKLVDKFISELGASKD